jgi:hypothetical protein
VSHAETGTAPRLPDFLIAGAAKCGTTSLASWLGAHPQAFVPAIKEVGYFALDHLYARGTEWYLEYFAGAGDARAVGEATPNYMFYPWSIERIAEDLPGVRVIVCLRNPSDRAYSHYLHWRDRLMLEPRTFAQAVEDELAAGGEEIAIHQRGRKPPYFAYVARGRYLEQIERLVTAFGRERVHVVLLDDMRADAAAEYARVCRFLGIDDGFVPATLGGSENRYQRHRRDRLLRPLVRARLMQRMPAPWSQWLVRHVFPPVEVPSPQADPAARARLLDFFAPHNAALGAWLGRDLSGWDR